MDEVKKKKETKKEEETKKDRRRRRRRTSINVYGSCAHNIICVFVVIDDESVTRALH